MSNKINPHFIQLDLTTRYNELLHVVCKHDYFKDKSWAGVEFVPSAETKELLRRLGLAFKQIKQGFMVGYRTDANHIPVKQVLETKQLTFWIKIADQHFLNYSELPYEFTQSIYHFSNKFDNKIDTANKNLSVNEAVSGQDRVTMGAQVMQYKFSQPEFNPEITIEDEMGRLIHEETLDGEHNLCNISLIDQPPGRYYLFINGIPEFDFYVVPPSAGRVFGAIDLFLDKNDDSTYSFFDANGDLIRQQYSLYIKNRAIHWKYLIIENTANPIHTDPQIMDSRKNKKDDGIQFGEPVEIVMETGQKATVIQSVNPIPFREGQDEKFKLRTKKGKTKIEWITDLPTATPKTNLKIDASNKNEAFSELIVYL